MNKKFRVIPALDLKDGIVVQGMKGEREKYQPIKSVLTNSAEISAVLTAFCKQLELKEFYVADLDAIMSSGQKNQLALIPFKDKSEFQSLSYMIDAGISNAASAVKVFAAGADKAVIGTETLVSLEALRELIKAWGSDKLIISIDMKDTKVLSPFQEIAWLTPYQAIPKMREIGIQHFILLELAKVGTGSGLDKEVILKCLEACQDNGYSTSTLILGGGVSGYEDLKWLADNGIAGAIVASALHNGTINLEIMNKLH